jgi:hypothetical protein
MDEIESPPLSLKLTNSQKQSSAWMAVLKHMHTRQAALREQNDGNHSAEVTANLRGQIAMLKELIDLDKDAPEIETSNL